MVLRIAGQEDAGPTQMIDGVRMPTAIVMRTVDELLPYARNSRTHSDGQIATLARNIERFGWTNPCLIADGGIIAGHGRVMAAKKLGLARVPCIDLSHLPEDDRRALVIADNRIAELSGWSVDELRFETDYLRDVGFDLEADLGFAEDDLAAILGPLEPMAPEGDGDPDDAPAAPDVPNTVPGDVWALGPHRVCCGSSTMPEDWDRLMAGEQADVVWTDPPYNVDLERKNRLMDGAVGGNRSATGGIANDKMAAAEFREFLVEVHRELIGVMKPGAPIYVAHSDKEGSTFRQAFDDAGFKFSSCIIWKKNTMVLGMSDYQPIHEPILYGWKPGSKHRWYGGRKNTSVLDLAEGGPFTRMEDGRYQIKVGDSVLVVSADAMVEEHASSVVYEPKPSKSGLHPTQKPVALVERMLRQSARPGDVVVDAFGGSGTTLIAADRMGMCARLMELDPKFVDVIVRRWEMLTGRRAVHAFTGEFFPADGEVRQAPAETPDPVDDPDPF